MLPTSLARFTLSFLIVGFEEDRSRALDMHRSVLIIDDLFGGNSCFVTIERFIGSTTTDGYCSSEESFRSPKSISLPLYDRLAWANWVIGLAKDLLWFCRVYGGSGGASFFFFWDSSAERLYVSSGCCWVWTRKVLDGRTLCERLALPPPEESKCRFLDSLSLVSSVVVI